MNKRLLPSLVLLALSFAVTAWAQTPPIPAEFRQQQKAPDDLETSAKRMNLPPAESERQQVQISRPEKSGVYGEWLFDGKFASESFTGFNPNYQINVGDTLYLKLWGAYEFEAPLTVDAQGNIFVPRVGPINVRNVRNEDLNSVVESRIKSIYRENVGVYASLATSQTVKVFVSGNVHRPGLYQGFAGDSVLRFLDQAGGISPQRGSYIDVRVLRDGELHKQINLYDFLVNGHMPAVQFRDGDSIFVGPLRSTIKIGGLVQNPYRIEFPGERLSLPTALEMARVMPNATHVRITRNQGSERNVDYVALEQAARVEVVAGDEIELLADKTIGTIIVQVEGEHVGLSEYVLPYGAKLGDLMGMIKPGPQSDLQNIQLFRKSLAERQKFMLEQSLRSLETEVLSARSDTVGEATLRTQEAQLIMEFIKRAEKVETRGQVVLEDQKGRLDVTLEDGDRVRVPKRSSLISLHGEVYFPSAFLYKDSLNPGDYIEKAGGFNRKADRARVLIMRQNGAVQRYDNKAMFRGDGGLQPGDEILVLPEVDTKSFQFSKDLIEVIYQIAVSAGVVLSI